MRSTRDSPQPSPKPRSAQPSPSRRPREDDATMAVGEHTSADTDTVAATDTVADTDTERSPRRSRWSRRDRRATLLGALLGCFVLLAAATVWFTVEVDGLRSGEPDENTALVDSDATDSLTADVSDGLKSVFSYNYTNLERTKRAAHRALLGDARQRYDDRFAKVTDTAKKDKLMRTASVRDIGVRSIDGDKAKLLVFLDQQTLTDKNEESGQQTISLDIVAKLVDGTWKIARFDDE